MEKRLVFAIALSLLVLLSWSAFVSKTYRVEQQDVTTQSAPIVPSESKYSSSTLIPSEPMQPPSTLPALHIEPEADPGATFQYELEDIVVTFIEPQAAIKEVIFKAYQDYKLPLEYGFFLAGESLSFKKISSSSDSVTFEHLDDEKRITKRFIFSKPNYAIELEVTVHNKSTSSMRMHLPLVLGVLDFSTGGLHARYKGVTAVTKEKTLHNNARKDFEFSELKFICLRDRYFCAIAEPGLEGNYLGFIRKINSQKPQKSEIGLSLPEWEISPGNQIGQIFHLYLGPQDPNLIDTINPDWTKVVHFSFISQILLQLLGFLYRIVHNWGLAIVILSFLVYFMLYPLTLKQMRSMKEMQSLQPHIEELRKTHKDNPQKMNKEVMGLYRQHKVNPLGGCLPLLLQMPIFFALYQALMRTVALKGARFLWIKDLSEPDRLFTLPSSLPVIGNEINILPIVMALGMFFQQKFSAVSTGGASAEQQKIMMIIFPLMFGFIFYHMPSGLVLYWLINSSLMMLHQLRARRVK